MSWGYFLTHFLPMLVITGMTVGAMVWFWGFGLMTTRKHITERPTRILRSVD